LESVKGKSVAEVARAKEVLSTTSFAESAKNCVGEGSVLACEKIRNLNRSLLDMFFLVFLK
jgi:hypothetical protein